MINNWLRRKRSSVAHLVMERTDSHVEFWSGAECDDSELLLRNTKTRKCQSCVAYKRHGVRWYER